MVFCLTEIMFRASGLSSPKKHPKTLEQQNLHPGLKTLIHQKEEEKSHHHHRRRHGQAEIVLRSYIVSKLPPSLSPPPLSSLSSSCSSIVLESSSSSSMMGDLVGTESGVYVSSNEEEILKPIERTISTSPSGRFNGRYWDKRNNINAMKKEYPPPIPLLARTGNLPGRMPWLFTRQYTHDGRLILRERREERHEYFHAHRENGRLILKLIPMSEGQEEQEVDFDDDDDDDDEVQELELEDVDHLQFVEQNCRGKEKIIVSEEEEEEEEEIESKDDNDDDHGDDEEDGIESKIVGKFPKFNTYASGTFMQDSKQCFSIDSVKVHEGSQRYLDQSSSSVPPRLIAAAM